MTERQHSLPRDEPAPIAHDNALMAAARKSDNALVQRLEKPIEKASGAVETVTKTRVVRTVLRFNAAEGNLLAAGMSFQAVFAVFAALYVGFAVAGIWISTNSELFDTLIDIINTAIPGLIGTNGEGLIQKSALTGLGIFGWTGSIALVGLLYTAIGWLAYTRQAVRSIFQLPKISTNFFLKKLSDLALALSFGVVLVLAAIASMLSTQAVSWLLGLIGVDSHSYWGNLAVGAVGLTVSVGLNLVTLASLYRVLARIPIPLKDLVIGSLIGSAALSVLSIASGAVLGGASRNPLLATFAVFIALLIWFNLVCRVILIAGAWIAEGLARRGVVLQEQTEEERLAALREARVLLAKTELEQASAQARAARGLGKLRARRRLERARAGLRAARDATD